MPEPLLRAEGLTVSYGSATALRDIDLEIAKGSLVAVLGANGAGKTSLARALSGLVPIAAGRLTLDGVDVTSWNPQRITRAGLVHLPEGRGIFPALTVRDNLRMWSMPLHRKDREDAIDRAVRLFPVLADRHQQLAGSLSGGEQQMLSLARSFVVRPKLLIADELSLGLAPKMVDTVFAGLQQAAADGVTVVMIEQFVHRALALASHCVVIRRGSLAWQGRPEDAEEHVLEHYLGPGEDTATVPTHV
jgi:branched-chain amino acid transport system ATP-binding protein